MTVVSFSNFDHYLIDSLIMICPETSSRGNIFPNAMKSKSEKALVPPKVEGVQAVPSPISQVQSNYF